MKKLGAILIITILFSGVATSQLVSKLDGNNFDSVSNKRETSITGFENSSEITVEGLVFYSSQPYNISYDVYRYGESGSYYSGTYEHSGSGWETLDVQNKLLQNPTSDSDVIQFMADWDGNIYWGKNIDSGTPGTLINGIRWGSDISDRYRYINAGIDVGIEYTVPNDVPVFNNYDTTSEWWIKEPINVSYNVTDPDGTVEEVTIEVTDSNGNVEKSETFTYSSSNVVDSHTDFFTPTEADNYTISYTATDDDQEDSATYYLYRDVKGYEFDKQLSVSINIENDSTVARGDVINDAGIVEFTMDEEINRKDFDQITVYWNNEIEKILTDFTFKAGTIDISDLNNGETVKRRYDYDTTDISNTLWTEIEQNNSDVGVDIHLLLEKTNSSGDVIETGDTYISRNDGIFRYFESFGDSGILYEAVSNALDWFWNTILEPILSPILDFLDWIWSGIVYALLFILDLLVIIVGMALQVLMWAIGSLTVALANSLQMFMFYHVDVDYEWRENNTTVETYDTFENLSEERDINFIQAINGNLSIKSGRTQVDVWDDRFGVDNYPILEYKNEAVVWRYNYSVVNATRQNVTEENVKSGDRK